MVPPFFTFQIGAQALALGLIALSLTFLAGSGGMISLAQMTVAGIAGYMVAIFGTAATDGVTLGWPWWLAVLLGIAIAVVAAAFIGWLSVRTEGIYTIMITLAIGVAFYYLALQNYAVFNGFQGMQKVFPPTLAGVYWRDPTAVLLPGAGLLAGGLSLRGVPAAHSLRDRAPGHPRQPAPHARPRLQRDRPSCRRLRGRRRASPPWAGCCSPGTTGW